MWPVIMKCNLMVWCRPVSTLQGLHHGVIFVLTTTVVSMQTGGGCTEAIMAKKEVQHTDNCIRPLPCITGLINNEVHLSGDGFAADPKDSGLPRC